jgi:hypothetical protein
MFDWVDDVVDVFTGDWGGVVETVAGEIFDDEGGNGGGGGAVVTTTGGGGGGGGFHIPTGEFLRVAGGGAVSSMGVMPYIGQGAAAAGRGAMGIITRWGKSMGAVLAGRGVQMRARDVYEIVKKYGPEVAAGVLGWTVAELMQVLGNLGAFTPKKRRRRGVSARDIRTTKRVCRFVTSVSRSLADCSMRARARGGARGGRGAQFVRQG